MSGWTLESFNRYPHYNESEVFGEISRRVLAVIDDIDGATEVIFIDDGSNDDTWAQIDAACTADNRVRGIELTRNHGYQIALSAGLEAAKGARVLMLDADLQDPPELLPNMLAMMNRGYDLMAHSRISASLIHTLT